MTAAEAKKISEKNKEKRKFDNMTKQEKYYISRFNDYIVGINKVIQTRANDGYFFIDKTFKTQLQVNEVDELLKTENQIAEALKNYFQLKGFKVVKCDPYKDYSNIGTVGWIGIKILIDWS